MFQILSETVELQYITCPKHPNVSPPSRSRITMLHSRPLFIALALFTGAIAAPTNGSSTASTGSSSTVSIESSAAASTSNTKAPGPPTPTSSSSAPASSFTAGLTSNDPNDSFLDKFQHEKPEAIRGSLGASVIGPQNIPLDKESPDLLAPPSTDSGSVDNARWPMSLSHNRIQAGGWARQENLGVMPIAEAMAGVNMRLEAGAIRELHWHATAEWAYVLKGTTRINSIDPNGRNYEADVHAGDVWYFPAGRPHALQATNDTAEGSEFLLVFDTGAFSEDDTFLLTDWLAHVPKEVLAKNFGTDISVFDHIPAEELYIFPSAPPPPINQDKVSDPQGTVPDPFSFPLSQSSSIPVAGGSVKILDSSTFKASATIAAAEVTVDVGGMRELHWHPTQAEWSFFIKGMARVTIFASSGNARTFDYFAGDVGYVPASNGHYVENIGNETLHFLEIFKTDKYEDISLNQWLALTPPELVKAHLNIGEDTLQRFNKTKQIVV